METLTQEEMNKQFVGISMSRENILFNYKDEDNYEQVKELILNMDEDQMEELIWGSVGNLSDDFYFSLSEDIEEMIKKQK